MLFKDVLGQEQVKEKLARSISQGKVPHAQLFLGPEGSGNLALAIAFAQYVICENKVDHDSCGKCSACQKASKLLHPDIHYTYPVITKKPGDKPKSVDWIDEWRSFVSDQPYATTYDWLQFIGAENKQGNITVEECNDIIRRMNLKTFESEYKILILWMPEYLGTAGNILLKLIEEPPENTLILLVANDPFQILSTILSRTQMVKTSPHPYKVLHLALMEKHDLNENEAADIANLADGNYHEAIQLMGQYDETYDTRLRDWLNACKVEDIVAISTWVDSIAGEGREYQKQFLKHVLRNMRESLHIKYGADMQEGLLDRSKILIEKLADYMTIEQSEPFVELLNQNYYFIERNANPKILFMNLSLQLKRFLSRKTLNYSQVSA